MNKRKILTMALAVCMVAILAVGGSLAYLTDTDAETNIFTTGNVKIDLYEDFTQDSKLLPTTGKDADGNIINAIKKEVYIKNTGTEPAYVRVHIAIPAVLDNGDPSFDASRNVLHFNYVKENIGEDKWDWTDATGAPYEGTPWNYYETTIAGIPYNVYVVTYEGELAKDATTENAMHQVYLDSKVTNDDISKIIEGVPATETTEEIKGLGEKWKIYVAAEATQVQGFTDAYAALNEAFGIPGSDDYKIEIVWDNEADVDTTLGE